MASLHQIITCLAGSFLVLILSAPAFTEQKEWIDLTPANKPLEAWDGQLADWVIADSVALNAKNPKQLEPKPGKGILVNGVKGRTHNLTTKLKFTDVDVHVEFLIPKGSNSGVKLMGLYEIQIFDSHDARDLTGNSCGGIYPRADSSPSYHYLDKGIAPLVNAARPAGEWQALDITFLAPRFDAGGKKTANARFVKVVLNDKVIHDNVQVEYPTGANWRLKEVASGPLLLQADHGPVAFRNVRVRPK